MIFVDAGLLPIIETIAPKLTDMLHDVVVPAKGTQMPADRLALAWRCIAMIRCSRMRRNSWNEPEGEMRDAAKINTLRVWRVTSSVEVFGVSRHMGLQNAVGEPGAGLGLQIDIAGHEDLLSG